MLKVVGASWTQIRISSWIIGIVIVLGIVAIIVSETTRSNEDGNYSATIYYDNNGKYTIEFWGQGNDFKEVPKGVARAHYDPHIKENGWAIFQVETQGDFPDEVQAFAAGYLEGALSWQMIYWHWKNTIASLCDSQIHLCRRIRTYLAANMEKTKEYARNNRNDPFWHQVHLFYVQINGTLFGFRQGADRSRQEIEEILDVDFIWMNSFSDYTDLVDALTSGGDFSKRWAHHSPLDAIHDSNLHGFLKKPDPGTDVDCGYKALPLSSTFVKFVPQNKKLFVAHNSAGQYSHMLKMFKRYEFHYHETAAIGSPVVSGTKLAFSSYPAALHSMDDFYIVSGRGGHNLALAATPITVFNPNLWLMINNKHQVLMGPRSLAANRLAKSAPNWVDIFSQHSSGTGNKAWAIVNMGLFEKIVSEMHNPKSFDLMEIKNVFWVLEQLPGNISASDQTELLITRTYWAAYGIPFYEEIFELSGTLEMVKEHGDVFSYDRTALANIFRRDYINVTDVKSALRLMKSNLYKVDPLTEGNPRCAVGSRGDVGVRDPPEPVGVTDIKVLQSNAPVVPFVPVRNTARMHIQYPRLFINAGPAFGDNSTGEDVEPFSWSKGNFSNVSHIGQPDEWKFQTISIEFV